MLRAVLVVLLLMGTMQQARAQYPSGPQTVMDFYRGVDSLEWMVLDSKVVIVGKMRFEPADDPLIDAKFQARPQLLIDVVESIKGPLEAGATIKVAWSGRGQGPLVRGQDTLLCLEEVPPGSQRWGFMPQRYVLLNGQAPATLMDFTKITRREEILELARRLAQSPSSDSLKSKMLTVPSLGPGVTVPINSRLEDLAKIWLKDPNLRKRLLGLQAIKPFKTPENLVAVKRLLDDTRSISDSGHGKWKRGYYHVRADAVDLLEDWREKAPDIPLGGPILVYQPLSLSKPWLVTIFALLAAWIITYLLLRRRTTFAGRLVRITTLLMTASLTAVLVAAWVRSYSQVDELMFARGSSHHEIASYHGGIQYLVLREWKGPSELVLGRFDPSIHGDVWAIEPMNRTATKRFIGFLTARGAALGPEGSIHPISLFRLPYWVLLIPCALLFVRELFLVLRYFRRRRLRLCTGCGYDLRESTSGKCPECGAASTSRIQTSNKQPIGGQPIGV